MAARRVAGASSKTTASASGFRYAAVAEHSHAKRFYVQEVRKPTIEEAQQMPREYCEMPNDMLMQLGALGEHDANQERLRREVMAVDNVSWDEAGPILIEITDANKAGMGLATFPNKLGVFVAMLTGVGSIPMVFQLDLALWFNEEYVTTDVPPPVDLETWLETGAWTWTWMEPVLGTASFTLLGFQFARAQMLNMRMKPYSDFMLKRRADNLVSGYPQYDEKIIRAFAMTDDLTPRDAQV
jgi:hypothetical protein